MNRLLTFIVVMAGSLTFMACEQENNNIELPQNDLVKIDIVAETPETRTYINEAQNRVEWSENDAIMVFENNKGKSSTATSISNGKATFSVSFAKSSNAPFYYNAIYPAASYIDDGSDITELMMCLNEKQNATATSFDAAADLLIAKQQQSDTQAESLMMQFKRIVALAKINIEGLPANCKINSAVFTANDKTLAGNCIVNLSEGEVIQYSQATKQHSIVVNYANAITGNDPIFFTCYPTMLEAGDSFNLTVKTDKGNYSKDVTISASKSIRFEEGNLSVFTVNMAGISPEEEVSYKPCTLYDEDGVKGVIYAVTTDNKGDTYVYLMSMDEEDLQWSTEYEWCNCLSNRGDYNSSDPFNLYGMDINNYPAFKWCKEHGEGWFLPSSAEMNMMWEAITDGELDFKAAKVAEYNKLLTDNGGEPFCETYYWSSNESSEDMIEVIAFMDKSYVCLEPYKDRTYTARAGYRFKVN